jgi:uncharacterized protein (DUF58 family)
MFVPSTRQLWFVGLVITPLAFALGVAGLSLTMILLVCGCLLGLTLLDALVSLNRLRAVEVTLPPLIRISKSKRFDLTAEVKDNVHVCRAITLGLALPRSLEVSSFTVTKTLHHADPKPESLTWELLALERGNSVLDTIYLQTPSALGFWEMRAARPVRCEIRVYPDLSREKNVLAPLFFRRGTLGSHQVRQVGKGREFQQLRAYLPGDSYDDVYWKGTAKRRFPVTMMHQIERTQELHVILDVSRRSARPLEASRRGQAGESDRFAPKDQCERFIQSALILALAAQQQGDRFGLMVFSDQVHTVLPAGSGPAHYNACRDTLYQVQPRVVSPDYQELFVQIGNRLRHRSLVIILTDLAEPWLSESFSEAVKQAARRHVILVHSLGSREFQPLFQKDSDIRHVDDLYGKLAGHLLWSDLQYTSRQLKQSGVHLTSSVQESLVADVVTSYLNVKKRQLL